MGQQQQTSNLAAAGSALRHLIVLIAVSAVMAAMALAMAAAPSMASNPCGPGEHVSKLDGSTCIHGSAQRRD